MTSKRHSCFGGIADEYLSCGCGRKDKMEEFEIVNMEDVRPYLQAESLFSTYNLARIPVDEAGPVIEDDLYDGNLHEEPARKAKSTLEQYFERSLTNAASPESWLNLSQESQPSLHMSSQSGPSLDQSSRKQFHAWQKFKAAFRRSSASEGAIVSAPKYTLADQVEAYKNIWSYDSSKVYYYEDIKATGALLLDLPPEMLVNLKYREEPFNNKSAEEVVRGYLAKLEGEHDTGYSTTRQDRGPELVSV